MSNPDLFIEGYRRKCGKYPSVYSEEVLRTTDPNKQPLEYPKGSGNYYYCGYKDYPYLGLTQNKMDNADEFPYYPCCYATDKNRKVWEKYLKDEETKKVSKTKSAKLIDRKAVKYLQNGKLPRNIYYILGGNFFRTGVAFGVNSFIHAVMMAVDPNYSTQKDTEKYVTDFRLNLAKSATPVRQSLRQSQEEINKMLLNPNFSFDSKIFVNYLSSHFNINIFVFERITDPNATFEIPDYTIAFLDNYSSSKDTVIIYKHYGTAGDNLQNPHYELIRTKDLLKFDSEIYKKLKKYFNKVYKTYNSEISQTDILKKLGKPCGQYIDYIGKVRGLCFLFDEKRTKSAVPPDSKVYIETSPLSIFNGVKEIKPFKNDKKLAEQFVETYKLDYTSENGGILIANYLKYFYIPVLGSEQGESDLYCWGTTTSVLKTIENNKRIANFLMQYALWAFSKFDGTPDEFIKKECVIKQNNEYITPRKFTKNSSYFEKGKLIVDSKTTLEKLKFLLTLNIKNKDSVSTKIYLDSYYDNVKYFTEQQGVIIFIGTNSITNWLTRTDPTKYVVYQINPETTAPQFFVNWGFESSKSEGREATNDNLIIAQNAGSKEEAVYLSKKYMTHRVNLYGVPLKGIDEPSVEFTMKGMLIPEPRNADKDKPWIYSDSGNWTALLR